MQILASSPLVLIAGRVVYGPEGECTLGRALNAHGESIGLAHSERSPETAVNLPVPDISLCLGGNDLQCMIDSLFTISLCFYSREHAAQQRKHK